MPLVEVGTVLCLEADAFSMINRPGATTIEYPLPFHPRPAISPLPASSHSLSFFSPHFCIGCCPQLERLVSRLLFEGRAHLPEEYPTPTGMIVEETKQQPSAFSSSSLSREPPTKPSLLSKAEELSGSLSRGATPAPTPEVQRAAHDPFDDGSSSALSEPQSPRDSNGFDDVGAGNERCAAMNTSAVQQASSNNDEGPHLPTAVVNTTAAAAVMLADQDVCGWDDEEEENLRGTGDEEGAAREREGKENEQAHGGAGDDSTEENSGGETKGPPSLAGSSSEPEVKHKHHETLEKEAADVYDHGQLDDEVQGYDEHRKTESKIEPLSTSPKGFVVAAATTTTLNEEPDRPKSSGGGDSWLGENDSDKGQKERKDEREEARNEEEVEEEVVEIEEEDDIPEDVESEELYETGSSHAEYKDGNEQSDDGGDNELRSKGDDGSSKEVDDTDNDINPFTSGGDVGIVVARMGAVNREGDHTENERASPRVIAGEEATDLETPAPPPVASPLMQQPSPTPASPTAPDTTPPSQGSGEERNSPSLSSPRSPSRDLAPMPSSPPGAVGVSTGTGASSLAALPLPPMGGARQRFGLLGSLPPVGGRGLPSLALPVGKKTIDAVREEGEGGGGVRRTGGGEAEDDAKGATGVTGTLVSGSASPLLSPRLSATRSSITEKAPAAVSDGEPFHLSQTASAQEKATDNDAADKDGQDGDGPDGLARPAQTRGRGGEEEEEQDGAKLEEAALRARLGLFGQDEDEDEQDEEEDEHGGGGDEGSSGGRENNNVSSPGSPKQHQGQEEENAGRVSRPNPRGEEGEEGAPIGSGAGGDYFGDSDEASSVDEDMSFEQESVDGDGGGDGTGSDDYFS